MKNISTWLLSIFGIVIIGVIADLLLSSSKVSKLVRSVFASVTLLVIITPLTGLLSGDGISFDFTSHSVKIDEGYISYVTERKEDVIEHAIESQLKEEGIMGARVTVALVKMQEEYVIDLVEINLSESVIDEKFEHINRNDLVVDLVLKYLTIEKEKVRVYG